MQRCAIFTDFFRTDLFAACYLVLPKMELFIIFKFQHIFLISAFYGPKLLLWYYLHEVIVFLIFWNHPFDSLFFLQLFMFKNLFSQSNA